MSELQISLLGIGVALVLIIYIYNWWQQRQYRRKFGAAFKHRHEDILYRPAEIMPTDELLAEKLVEKIEEAVSIDILPRESQPGSTIDAVCVLLDEKSDYIAMISPKSPVSADTLKLLWQQRFDFGKNVHVCGLNAASGEWEKVIADSPLTYTSFKLALQLVNRSGAVSEAKLMDFRELARTIAAQLHTSVVLPDVAKTAAYAVELDKFCAGVDQMIGLNILPNDKRVLTGNDVASVAEQYDLRLQADGAFHRLDTYGHTLFSLCNEDNSPFQHHTLGQLHIDGLTLLLDVPRVEQPSLGFDQMVALARQLAIELHATIVDANHVALSEDSITLIRERIAAVEAEMQASHIIAGSAQARRLFS
ncbi:Cell division protein ZipA [Candidatus Nitrotoga sp. HW29]|uniref:cell division protein ZipA C-terminal FtsZ-binding domain-containing protein n=1 Tax=Candidatus Nitrotoga sp. HW29 TaxID=2886963 RepID=UPI001EF240EE|nr:cell division protein ZipA C-terminal FtsZ-binding domain-containing protein [Candidatus Nitrotoga sp. HW29]CAH1903397.1 Cell division protein ZipA [Candidatus Nitrotoga sp. HW29]